MGAWVTVHAHQLGLLLSHPHMSFQDGALQRVASYMLQGKRATIAERELGLAWTMPFQSANMHMRPWTQCNHLGNLQRYKSIGPTDSIGERTTPSQRTRGRKHRQQLT